MKELHYSHTKLKATKISASIFSKLKRNLFKRNLKAGELIAQRKNVVKSICLISLVFEFPYFFFNDQFRISLAVLNRLKLIHAFNNYEFPIFEFRIIQKIRVIKPVINTYHPFFREVFL